MITADDKLAALLAGLEQWAAKTEKRSHREPDDNPVRVGARMAQADAAFDVRNLIDMHRRMWDKGLVPVIR